MNRAALAALIACLTLSGCVTSLRGVAEKKPKKPVEHVILLFGIPVYYSADTRMSHHCGEMGKCPMHGMPGGPHGFHHMPPPPGGPGFHGGPDFRGGPGFHRGPGPGGKPDCCDKKHGEKKMECCEKMAAGMKMECCEEKGGEKKMECCEEDEKGKDGKGGHEHPAHDAPGKK